MSNTKPTGDQITLEPVLLQPIFVERVWGTNSLQSWYPGHAVAQPVGEVWLTANESVVASGEHEGSTLAQLTRRFPDEFGDPEGHGFPLLIKMLFPREKLSVQVHPNDEQAQANGEPRGKTECWYLLEAEPGAEVALGFKDPLTPADVRAGIQDGTLEQKLRMLPVQRGDMVLVDAGTVHAIGPGVVILETQQYSDTTFRLWDYGRPRELHVEAGMAVTRTDTAAGLVPPQHLPDYTRLSHSAYFTVDKFILGGAENVRLDNTDKLQILIAVHDGCSVVVSGDHTINLPRAQAVLLPATHGNYALHSSATAQVIRVLNPVATARQDAEQHPEKARATDRQASALG